MSPRPCFPESEYRVIGIDPALVNTGLCVLETAGPAYKITDHATIVTHPRVGKKGAAIPLLDRLRKIQVGVDAFIGRVAGSGPDKDIDVVVIEGGRARTAARNKNPEDLVAMALAIGVVAACVIDRWWRNPVALTPPDQWMPRVRSGNREHTMEHSQIIRFLSDRIGGAVDASEHVVMAAGVARHWIEMDRLAKRRASQGINVG